MPRHSEAAKPPDTPLDTYRRADAHPCRSKEAEDRLYRAADKFRKLRN